MVWGWGGRNSCWEVLREGGDELVKVVLRDGGDGLVIVALRDGGDRQAIWETEEGVEQGCPLKWDMWKNLAQVGQGTMFDLESKAFLQEPQVLVPGKETFF